MLKTGTTIKASKLIDLILKKKLMKAQVLIDAQ